MRYQVETCGRRRPVLVTAVATVLAALIAYNLTTWLLEAPSVMETKPPPDTISTKRQMAHARLARIEKVHQDEAPAAFTNADTLGRRQVPRLNHRHDACARPPGDAPGVLAAHPTGPAIQRFVKDQALAACRLHGVLFERTWEITDLLTDCYQQNGGGPETDALIVFAEVRVRSKSVHASRAALVLPPAVPPDPARLFSRCAAAVGLSRLELEVGLAPDQALPHYEGPMYVNVSLGWGRPAESFPRVPVEDM